MKKGTKQESKPQRFQRKLTCLGISYPAAVAVLTFKGEVQANLVGSAIELLCVEGRTETERHAGTKKNIVSKSSNATLVDFDLLQDHCEQ